MSLIDAFMSDFVLMVNNRTPDGSGGSKPGWTEGMKFRAALTLDGSMAATMAGREGFKNIYTLTTPRTLKLEYHDVFKRLNDGAIFRVTSDPTDKESPNFSTLDIRQCNAEKWELTT